MATGNGFPLTVEIVYEPIGVVGNVGPVAESPPQAARAASDASARTRPERLVRSVVQCDRVCRTPTPFIRSILNAIQHRRTRAALRGLLRLRQVPDRAQRLE